MEHVKLKRSEFFVYAKVIVAAQLLAFLWSIFSRSFGLVSGEPGYAEAWYNQSAVLASLKRYEEALASCDSSLKYDPEVAAYLDLRREVIEKLSEGE